MTQNGEPNDNPDTAPTIEKNTLAVGHIASSGDVDFRRFSVTGLAPGTKVTVYLKVPRDADLDLVVNRPGAPGVLSSAAGSIPAGSIAAGSIAAGSIPLEDSLPGVDNTRNALQPDSAADLAAGSIPAGSIAAGSISANRGAVNEAAQIVTRGESGAAVIGVSGYNGAFSNENYVLRVKVTPPPTLPRLRPDHRPRHRYRRIPPAGAERERRRRQGAVPRQPAAARRPLCAPRLRTASSAPRRG